MDTCFLAILLLSFRTINREKIGTEQEGGIVVAGDGIQVVLTGAISERWQSGLKKVLRGRLNKQAAAVESARNDDPRTILVSALRRMPASLALR
jgi:hypothetical protein